MISNDCRPDALKAVLCAGAGILAGGFAVVIEFARTFGTVKFRNEPSPKKCKHAGVDLLGPESPAPVPANGFQANSLDYPPVPFLAAVLQEQAVIAGVPVVRWCWRKGAETLPASERAILMGGLLPDFA